MYASINKPPVYQNWGSNIWWYKEPNFVTIKHLNIFLVFYLTNRHNYFYALQSSLI